MPTYFVERTNNGPWRWNSTPKGSRIFISLLVLLTLHWHEMSRSFLQSVLTVIYLGLSDAIPTKLNFSDRGRWSLYYLCILTHCWPSRSSWSRFAYHVCNIIYRFTKVTLISINSVGVFWHSQQLFSCKLMISLKDYKTPGLAWLRTSPWSTNFEYTKVPFLLWTLFFYLPGSGIRVLRFL